MSTTFCPPFPLPSLAKPHTSVCDLNIRNTLEELHNFVDEVHCMLSFILRVIVKLIAFISIHLYFLTLYIRMSMNLNPHHTTYIYPSTLNLKPHHTTKLSNLLTPKNKTTSHHQTLQPSNFPPQCSSLSAPNEPSKTSSTHGTST